MKPTLLVLAAGMGSRYGGLKQLDSFGAYGELLIEYSIYDAIRAGFGKVVFVIRRDLEQLFYEKIGHLEQQIHVEYVFQDTIFDLNGVHYGEHRTKPWGSAQALLAGASVINEPFAVINSDDYYGPDAYVQLAKFLQQDLTENNLAMVGYVLGNTLSDHGTVNRGVCVLDEKHQLVSVEECYAIAKNDAGKVVDKAGNELSMDTIVSMNFWGFHPNIFPALAKEFEIFITENKENPTVEFYLPGFVDMLLHRGSVCPVLVSKDSWCGVTYPEDKPKVAETLSGFIAEGRYPPKLRA
ncbi:MAG: sugar phosphate nucleotidyltransferase [Candidatus Absconditabacteria bacterium]